MIKKYTSIFFDLDDTLLDFKLAEASAVRKVLKGNNLPFSDEAVQKYSEINRSYWESFERGEIPKSMIYAGRFKTFMEFYKVSGDAEKIAKEYCEALSFEHQLIDGAIEILEYLISRCYKIYATTNGLSITQYRRIEQSGLKKYFEGVFVSEDAGHQKPEKEYFDYVISKIPEKDIKKILIIGDSLSSDIKGGINAGIDSCWYNPNGKETTLKTKYIISNLMEVKNILK